MDRDGLDVLQALREVEDRDDTPDEQVRHIGQALDLDEGEVRARLDRLAASGHVAPPGGAPDAESGRPHLFTLTRDGRQALADGPES